MNCVTGDSGSPRCINCYCSAIKFVIPLERVICGTNNVTYGNHCQMRTASCQQSLYIGVKYFGPCKGTVSHDRYIVLLIVIDSKRL